MSADLLEILPNDWPCLRDLYKEQKNFASSFNTLQIFINWHGQNPAVDLKLYTLDENWRSDGTFLAYTSNQIICNTLNADLTRLTCALRNFNAGPVYVVGGFREHVKPAVEEFIAAQAEEFLITPTLWYSIQEANVKSFSLSAPIGIAIKSLHANHVEVVNSFWPHSWPSAKQFVENMISFNESVGAFDEAGNLVAWCLINPIGHLALLHVIDSHKRQGLGSLLVRLLSKKLLENNLEVLTSIVNENHISRSLFEKLGFRIVDNVFWAFKLNK